MQNGWNSSLLALTATELREKLQNGVVTSHQLVEACLAQIQTHNRDGMVWRAMISIFDTSKALAEADRLDQERKDGKLRGQFHEIPIVIKVRSLYKRDLC